MCGELYVRQPAHSSPPGAIGQVGVMSYLNKPAMLSKRSYGPHFSRRNAANTSQHTVLAALGTVRYTDYLTARRERAGPTRPADEAPFNDAARDRIIPYVEFNITASVESLLVPPSETTVTSQLVGPVSLSAHWGLGLRS
jgi:hypothetical protein